VTIRGRHRLAASLLLAAVGTGCGGGASTSSTVAPSAARPRAPSSSGPPATAKPAVVGGQPEIVDRGADVAEVARSLLLFGRWLEWHHPDPALVGRAYQPGSPPARVMTDQLQTLRRIGARIEEVDGRPLDLTVVSRKENAVSFLVVEHLEHRELIATNARVLEHDPARAEYFTVAVVRAGAGAPWRVSLVERRPPKIEVQL
jgi:hypothetical protein